MATLFPTNDGLPAQADRWIISEYAHLGRTLDDLPYTDEFEKLYQQVGGTRDRAALFHHLHNLRKAGRMPPLGRAESKPPRIAAAHESLLQRLVIAEIGALSLRDRLPYTDPFDRLVAAFNAQAGLSLSPHDVWRLVAKLAK